MGELLALSGLALMAVGSILLLWAAFKESVLWGLGSLFVPLVMLFFVATHWSRARTGFLIQVAGLILFLVGGASVPDAVTDGSL